MAQTIAPTAISRIEELDRLAHLLDDRFRIPGTNIRFGWDGILTFIPGLGDAATLLPGAYILWRGYRLGVRKRTLTQMAGNTALDLIVGVVPLIGDLFDIGFKANLRNIRLIKGDVLRGSPAEPKPATLRVAT